MTEERKKYLASISKEEKAIRHFLEIYSSSMKHLKLYLNTSDYKDIKGAKNAIAETKTIIKVLKKQIPAPRHEQYDYISDSSWLDCSCGKGVYSKQPYCMWCGRKLR